MTIESYEEKLEKLAKELHRNYLYEWRNKNREKVRAYQKKYQETYWLRKAEKELLKEQELLKSNDVKLSK